MSGIANRNPTCPEILIIYDELVKLCMKVTIGFKYDTFESVNEIIPNIQRANIDIILVIAPPIDQEKWVTILRKESFPFQIITEDHLDQRFRYLNLITDLAVLNSFK